MIFAGGFDLVELCLSSGNIFRFLIMFDVGVECPFMAAGCPVVHFRDCLLLEFG